MTTQFNFQINPDEKRQEWSAVPVYKRACADRIAAVQFAKKLAQLYKAEVRLSEGSDAMATSGSYFR